MSTERRYAIINMNLGPHHVARLEALAKVAPGMHAVEVGAAQERYPWRAKREGLGPLVQTLFPDRTCERISAPVQCGAIRTALSRIDPSVIIVAGYREPVMDAATSWARKHTVPVVLLFVSTWQDKPRVWWRERLKRAFIRRYAAVAATGQRAEDYARSLGVKQERIVKIGNVVDNAHFEICSEAIRRDDSKHREQFELPDRYFVTVSRLSPEKNLRVLVQAFLEYRRCGGLWDLVIVGSGPQEKELRLMLSRQDVQAVHLVPWASYEELPRYYALASCSVLPSVSEPWGLVVNEAMACSLPVLVSRNCGCFPELCRPGENGYVFDPNSVEELRELMLQISSREEHLSAMGQVSRRIIESFTPQTWAARVNECMIAAESMQ